MRLTMEDVEHVSTLARLGLTDAEKERLRDQLSSILEHIEALSAVDTASIPPTAQVNALSNVWREDTPGPSLPIEAVLANAPRSVDGFFEVNAVLTSEPDSTG